MFDKILIKHKPALLNPYADQILRAIADRQSVMAIVGSDDVSVSAIVNECSRRHDQQAARIAVIVGTPDATITLYDIIRRLIPVEQGTLPADDDELILYMLASGRYKHEPVLLIIQRAELLPLRTLIFLQMLVTGCSAVVPHLQLLFAGHPTFLNRLQRQELGDLHDRLGTTAMVPASSSRTTLHKISQRCLELSRRIYRMTNIDGKRSRAAVVGLAILVLVCGSLLARTFYQPPKDAAYIGANATNSAGSAEASLGNSPALDPSLSDRPAATVPMLPGQPPTAATMGRANPSAPSKTGDHELDTIAPGNSAERPDGLASEQLMRLRRDFERFLAQTDWASRRSSDGERSRLFTEFLQWSAGGSTSGPTPAPKSAAVPLSANARVTLYSAQGSANGTRVARQIMQKLQPSVTRIRARTVNNPANVFEVRYLLQEDKPAAEQLAKWLQDADMTWTVRAITEPRQKSATHTFELWIPLQ